MSDESQTRTHGDRLLGVIVAVVGIWFLKWAEPVTLPLTFALFVVLLAWPLQAWLQRRIPHGAAYGLTLLTLLAVAGLFSWMLIESVDEVIEWVQASSTRLEAMVAELQQALKMGGLAGASGSGDGSATAMSGAMRRAVSGLTSFMGFVLLVTALCVLALREVDEFRHKFKGPLRHHQNAALIDSAGEIVVQVQRYVLTRCMTSGLTGLLTGLFAWAVGLELALAWGVLTTLLNFIPTLGTLAAVGGITVFAYLQFQTVGMALLVFGVTVVMQTLIGSFIDPLLQGRSLSMSPFAVLLSVVFWGWMWGIPGSLLGVPLTAALLIAFREFDSTRWIAELLDNERPTPPDNPPAL